MGTLNRKIGPSHLRGKVGDFIYKWYGKRLVVTALPRRSDKAPTAQRRRTNNIFRDASKYALRIRGSELWKVYEAAAKNERVPTRSIAMHDYMAKPSPGGVRVGTAYGRIGATIAVYVRDKYRFKTTAIDVVIRNAQGKCLARGAAEMLRGEWRYTLPVNVPEGEDLTFEVTAHDRFGKTGHAVSHAQFRKMKWRKAGS